MTARLVLAQYVAEATWPLALAKEMHVDEQEQQEKCLEAGDDCRGPVEFRLVGERAWPRCVKHHGERLDRRENSLERYADSVSAPSWFDPSYAGESW